jgi:hypothetical protein
MKIVKNFQDKYQQLISIEQMAKTLKTMGYAVRSNIISNIEDIPMEYIKMKDKDDGEQFKIG